MVKGVGALLVLLLALPLLAAAEPDAEGTGDDAGTEQAWDWLHDARIGVLGHDLGIWSGSRRERGSVDINAELVFMRDGFDVGVGRVHPNLGFSINTEGETSKLYAGFLWELRARFGGFIDLGLNAAIHDGTIETDKPLAKELGTRVLFRVPVEIGYALTRHHRVSVMFDHISNASLASTNEGLDTLGIRYGYVF